MPKAKANELSKLPQLKINIEKIVSSGHYQLKRLAQLADDSFRQYKIELDKNELERDIAQAKWHW